jgi:putative flippase GtrA
MMLLKNFFSRFKIVKFGIVGSLSAITNLTLFFIFVDLLKFNGLVIIIVNFIICVSQNYVLNHVWTFRLDTKEIKLNFKQYVKFFITSLLGFGVNIIVYMTIDFFIKFQYKFIIQGIGILSGMIFNFLGSKFFVFNRKFNII